MIRLMCFFKQAARNEIAADVWADTFSGVLLELLPLIGQEQGIRLLSSGITYLQNMPGELHYPALSQLRENLNDVAILCNTSVVPQINPELFRAYIDQITAWIKETFAYTFA